MNTIITVRTVKLSATGGASGNPVVFASATPRCAAPAGQRIRGDALGLGYLHHQCQPGGQRLLQRRPEVRRSFKVTATPQLAQVPVKGCVTPPTGLPLVGIRQVLQAPASPMRVSRCGCR